MREVPLPWMAVALTRQGLDGRYAEASRAFPDHRPSPAAPGSPSVQVSTAAEPVQHEDQVMPRGELDLCVVPVWTQDEHLDNLMLPELIYGSNGRVRWRRVTKRGPEHGLNTFRILEQVHRDPVGGRKGEPSQAFSILSERRGVVIQADP